jgi:hypothetical protein
VKLRCEGCRKENKKCEDNRPCRFCIEEGLECVNAVRKGRGHGTRVMAVRVPTQSCWSITQYAFQACTNCRFASLDVCRCNVRSQLFDLGAIRFAVKVQGKLYIFSDPKPRLLTWDAYRPCAACVRKGYECVDRACKSCTQKGKETECTHRKTHEVGNSDLDGEFCFNFTSSAA